ncbi:MAG TPA: acyclic terpene utilization AtuA family protein, partial [Thermoanaerobaculia bacterium]
MKTIRIGNGQGFWGDNVDAPVELLRGGPVDYIGMDYLAEVTLSIMMRQKLRNPKLGYATDFVGFIRRVLPEIKERNVRILTNAGGLNPRACRNRIFEVARELGVTGLRVGVVEGDDLLPRLRDLIAAGHPLKNMDNDEPLEPVVEKVMSANAYLGARPMVEALAQGAHIVLCGRITDTALALAPMIHEFGWSFEDWNLMAAGTIAGHIIECGAQCTGGNFSRWWEVPDLWNVGYPVIEAREDGTFVVTKNPGTGGMVTVDTVAEQLVYEMGDPSGYITPDVTADFTSIRLRQDGKDRVEVSGIQGRPNTPFLKVSASYLAGYKASGQITLSGPRAIEKAKLAAEIVWKRLERAGVT